MMISDDDDELIFSFCQQVRTHSCTQHLPYLVSFPFDALHFGVIPVSLGVLLDQAIFTFKGYDIYIRETSKTNSEQLSAL